MAHKQGGGSTKNNRDSKSKRLGIKIFERQKVNKGEILVRQRGFNYKHGVNVGLSKDFTLYSLINGFLICLPNQVISVIPYL